MSGSARTSASCGGVEKAPEAFRSRGSSFAPQPRLRVLGFGVDRLLGRGLVVADGALLAADLDLLRLHRLGDLALELDRQHPVLHVRALDLDMVGKREAALERAVGDPAIDEVAVLLLTLLGLAARDDQLVLLAGDVDLVRREPGDGELDAIIVVALLDQIEGRVIFLAPLAEAVVLEHVEQPVEADSGTPERREIESTTHGLVLQLSNKAGERLEATAPSPGPNGARHARDGWKTAVFKAGAMRFWRLTRTLGSGGSSTGTRRSNR